MSWYNRFHRLLWIFLFICSIGLLACSCFRAATFPFTHDESLSFAGFTWQTSWAETSNNHLLNTWLMELCSSVFGNSEFSLRLPNILAQCLYLVCTLAIIKRFQNALLQIMGFVILNLNPYVLDFFPLARGYGLALGFQMLSIYFVICAFEKKKQRGYLIFLFFSTFAGALSVLANFAFLNFYLPLLLINAWLFFSDETLLRFNIRNLTQAIICFSLNGIALTLILIRIFKLRNAGELYFGGKTGFVNDIIGSLVKSSLYSPNTSAFIERALIVVIIGLLLLLVILAFYQFLVTKEISLFTIFSILLVLALALPFLQVHILHTLYPIDREALYYIPLFSLALLSALYVLIRFSHRRSLIILTSAIPALITLFVCWNFYNSFNIYTIHDWGFDAHDKQVLEIINQDRYLYYPDQTINIGNTWLMEPSLNFYRITDNYTWLAPVTRKSIDISKNDYVYAYESDIQGIEKDRYSIMVIYPDTKTVLLRVNQTHKP